MRALGNDERDLIRRELAKLEGSALTNMFRYLGHQAFVFGERAAFIDEDGKEAEENDKVLSVHCHWSLTGDEGFHLGSEHFPTKGRRKDGFATPFYDLVDEDGPVLLDCQVSAWGDLALRFSRGYRLEVKLDDSYSAGDHQWQLQTARDDPRGTLWFEVDRLLWSNEEPD